MFGLYHNKEDCKLIIEPWNDNLKLKENEVRYWNENWYLSNNRKLLREKAKELQQKWIEETENYLENLRLVKVKTKYK